MGNDFCQCKMCNETVHLDDLADHAEQHRLGAENTEIDDFIEFSGFNLSKD